MILALVLVGVAALIVARELLRRDLIARGRPIAAMVAATGATYLAIALGAFVLHACFTQRPSGVVEVYQVEPGFDATAHLAAGDAILAVDHERVTGAQGLRAAVNARAGKPVVLTIERGGRELDVPLQPTFVATSQAYLLGIRTRARTEPEGTGEAIGNALVEPIARCWRVVLRLVPNEDAEPSGPRRIVEKLDEALETSVVAQALAVWASLCSLALVVLLALDVGRFVTSGARPGPGTAGRPA